MTSVPRSRVKEILKLHNLSYKIILELNGIVKNCEINLDENGGAHLFVIAINENLYIGSASKGYVYRRYRSHLFHPKMVDKLWKKGYFETWHSNFCI